MTFDEILSRLEGVHRSGNQATARCPAHDDKTASLSVSTGKDGRILLNCHAGCSSEAIVEALGLSMNDLFPEKPRRESWELVAQYDYKGAGGKTLYRKIRWRKPDGNKSFSWRHPNGRGGWDKGRGTSALGLYHLPEVAAADKVYLVEGEKDVETLGLYGRVATSPPDGAGSDWKPQYTEALKGKAVIILEDNDAPGKAFARKAAEALHGAAASVKVIDLTREWDDLPEHGDISDVLAAHPAEDVFLSLDALELMAPELDPREAVDPEEAAFFACFRPLSDFEEQKATWLVPGWIPEGQITLLAADGGIGKTTIWCNVIAAISAGRASLLDPEGYTRAPSLVAFLTTEDSVRKKLKKKLREAGANMGNIITPDFLADKSGILRELKFGGADMERFIRHFRPKLCVFDPVQGFVPPEINMGSRNAMRDCMAPLISLGEECGTTFWVVCHTNKRKGTWGRDRIADSADLWDVSRSVLMAGYTDDQNIRYLSNEKNNYETLQETILFSIDGDGQPHKEGTTWKRDRDFMQEATAAKSGPRREECKEVILKLLEENGMKMPSKELDDRLKLEGYGFRACKEAKKELKESGAIRYKREGFGNSGEWYVEKTEFSEPESYSISDDE